MHLVIIGGSDAGISAALRAKELRTSVDVTVILADRFPNYSICGLPFYISGETCDWNELAHRTKFDGIELLCDHVAHEIQIEKKHVIARDREGLRRIVMYDKLIVATGAKPAIPDIPGI